MHGHVSRASEGMTESFAQLFEQSLANQRIRPGMILTGLIVDVTDDVVIVNVGSWVVPGILCSVIYLLFSLPLSRYARRLEARWSVT